MQVLVRSMNLSAQGHFRAKRKWSRDGVVVDVADEAEVTDPPTRITPADLEALRRDPMMFVQEITPGVATLEERAAWVKERAGFRSEIARLTAEVDALKAKSANGGGAPVKK